MDVRLTNSEVALLQELVAAGDKGRIVSARSPSPLGLMHLVRQGYVLEQHISVGSVLYTITVSGKHALIRHQGRA